MKFKNSRKKNNNSSNSGTLNDLEDYEEPQKWYSELAEDPKSFPEYTEQTLIDLKDEAKKCHDAEVANYNIKSTKTDPNFQWMKTVMIKGTVSDKVAAHIVSVQNNPVCNLETIRNLVGMVKVGKKKECIVVMDGLTELFLSDLLRPDKKLRAFHQRPLSVLNTLTSGNAVSRRKLLSVWYFEDQLKEIYVSFVLALNNMAHDSVDSNKEKAITAIYKLLAGNSEQEQNLLKHIVNKLGDPSQKVASKVIYCLTQLLHQHLNMQGVVLNEIEKLLFRPNIPKRAQYYSLCFLSQYYLSNEASDIARKLIEVYFSFFKACIKMGDVDSRMMSALLMGINRAYPYAKIEYDKISEHIDTMYRLVHLTNFNISLHALAVLYQVSDFGNNIKDRFYGALYRKLLDPTLLITTHRAMLLSLIYKALLKDKDINRVKVFIKRLLQISLYAQPCFTSGILYLISQIMKKKDNLQAFILKQTTTDQFDDDDDEEEKYQDVKEENIDTDILGIEIKEEPVDDTELKDAEKKVESENNDQQSKETLSGVINPDEIEIKDEDVKPDIEILENSINGKSSWYHCKNIKKEKGVTTAYNPLARNPLYCGGEFCAYTELHNLRNHFHPTVSLFASNILKGETVKYSGDPLNDFTLIKFLDRFVFKNPKKVGEKPGINSILGKRKLLKPKGIKLLPVQSVSYIKENPANIPVDELFLHSYLQKRYTERQTDDDSDLESVQSEEFEEMLDKMAGVKDNDEDIDYLQEIGDSLKKKEKKKKKTDPGEEAEENEMEELSEDEISNTNEDIDDLEEPDDDDEEGFDLDENDEDLIGDLSGDEADELEFLDEDNSKNKKSKFKKKNVSSIFASADEFATLLEEEGSSKIKPGGSNAFANRDNADMKQLNWEEKRNRWLQGFDQAVKRKKGQSFRAGNEKFSKKRPNQNKFGNKRKKFKKQ